MWGQQRPAASGLPGRLVVISQHPMSNAEAAAWRRCIQSGSQLEEAGLHQLCIASLDASKPPRCATSCPDQALLDAMTLSASHGATKEVCQHLSTSYPIQT